MRKKILPLLLLLVIALPVPTQASFQDDISQFKQKYADIYQNIDPVIAQKMDLFLLDVVDYTVRNYDDGINIDNQIKNAVASTLLTGETYKNDLLPFLLEQTENKDVYRSQLNEMLAIVRTEVLARLQSGAAPVATYTVVFDMQGHGTQIGPLTVNQSDTVAQPADPTEEGWIFGGWFKEAEYVTAWDFANDTVTSDTTLFAQWTAYSIAAFSIAFDANGGTVTSANVETGADGKLASLPIPARDGYIFDGWYTSVGGGDKITKDTVFTENSTAYARWISENFIPGDVTSDSKVTRADLLRLAKHFSGFTVVIDEAASDVTGDGKVTRADLLRLAKHFSGYDVILGK